MKVSLVNSAGGSFCCNYATDLCIYSNYASGNVCCIFAGFQVLRSVTGMLVDLSVTIKQVTIYHLPLPKKFFESKTPQQNVHRLLLAFASLPVE